MLLDGTALEDGRRAGGRAGGSQRFSQALLKYTEKLVGSISCMLMYRCMNMLLGEGLYNTRAANDPGGALLPPCDRPGRSRADDDLWQPTAGTQDAPVSAEARWRCSGVSYHHSCYLGLQGGMPLIDLPRALTFVRGEATLLIKKWCNSATSVPP